MKRVDTEDSVRQLLDAGWQSLQRAAWEEARDAFESAVAQDESAEALEGLGWAAWWLNDAEALFHARERAYTLYRSAEDPRGAARVAAWIATDHVDFRGEIAVAQGWFGRARRMLEGLEPGAEHGWLSIHEAEKYIMANHTARAREAGAYAAEIGRRIGVVELEMMGLSTEGLALVTEGRADEGMPRLDEAGAAAFGGEFKQIWASAWCGCYLLYACERIRDYERAAEWCRTMEAWSERVGSPFANRVCRAHYAGVLIWNGDWDRAEVMLVEAEERLSVIRPPMASEASVRLAELRRRQGRLDEAERIFAAVAEHDLALIGLGEICLDRGDAVGARERAQQYLREVPPETSTVRAPGLELLVRANAALGQLDDAQTNLKELRTIAEDVQTDPIRASATLSAGVVALASGEVEQARIAFEDATRIYQRSGAPFEAGRARIELACVLAALGRPVDAARELRSAATSLRRIGAEHEAARADSLGRDIEGQNTDTGSPLTPREREVLRLVAAGKADRVIADELVLSEHTVHRHVANILAKLGCSSRSAAVAEALRKQLI